MDPLELLAMGSKVGGDLVGQGIDAYNASENRKLTRRGLQQQAQNQQFQRLMDLINQSSGMQQNAANAQRLFSLRNTAAMG